MAQHLLPEKQQFERRGFFPSRPFTRFDRIRDVVNALRRAEIGRVPAAAQEVVGGLTAEGRIAKGLTSVTEAMTDAEFVVSVNTSKDYSPSNRRDFIVQEGKAAEAKAPKVTRGRFREFTSSEARRLVIETVTDIVTDSGITDPDEIRAINDMVIENLFSDMTIDTKTGDITPFNVPFGTLFPNLPTHVSIKLQQRSEEILVDALHPLEANKIGAAIGLAYDHGLLDNPGLAIDITKLTPAELEGIGDLNKAAQDMVAWLDKTGPLVKELAPRFFGEGIDLNTGLGNEIERQMGLNNLDPKREWHSPGFDPSVERAKQFEENFFDAFGDPKGKPSAQVEEFMRLLGADIRTIDREDTDRKAINRVKKPFIEDIARRIQLAKLDPDVTTEDLKAQFMQEIIDFAGEGGEYHQQVQDEITTLELAPEEDTTTFNTWVRNEFRAATGGLDINEFDKDVLADFRAQLTGMPKDEARAYIEQNAQGILDRSELAKLTSDADIEALIKTIPGLPTLDQLGTPEAKAAFSKWLKDTVDAVQAAEPVPPEPAQLDPSFFSEFGRFVEPLQPVPPTPAEILQARIGVIRGAGAHLQQVLAQTRIDTEAATFEKRGVEGLNAYRFREGIQTGTLLPEDELLLQRVAAFQGGFDSLGSPEKVLAIFEGFEGRKKEVDALVTAGFSRTDATDAVTGRLGEAGIGLTPAGGIGPLPTRTATGTTADDYALWESGALPSELARGGTFRFEETVPALTTAQTLAVQRAQLDPQRFPTRPTVDEKGNPIPTGLTWGEKGTEAGPFGPAWAEAENIRGLASMQADQEAEASRLASQLGIDMARATAERARQLALPGASERTVAPLEGRPGPGAGILEEQQAADFARYAAEQRALRAPTAIGFEELGPEIRTAADDMGFESYLFNQAAGIRQRFQQEQKRHAKYYRGQPKIPKGVSFSQFFTKTELPKLRESFRTSPLALSQELGRTRLPTEAERRKELRPKGRTVLRA